jgi:hypothetical protein
MQSTARFNSSICGATRTTIVFGGIGRNRYSNGRVRPPFVSQATCWKEMRRLAKQPGSIASFQLHPEARTEYRQAIMFYGRGSRILFSHMPACYFLNPTERYTSIVLVDCAVNRQVGPPQW